MSQTNVSMYHSDLPQEACGITGMLSKTGNNIAATLVRMQENLQHRGQDSAGIAIFTPQRHISVYKNIGLVRQVFPKRFPYRKHDLVGSIGIGHNRYGTSGDDQKDNVLGAQPAVVTWQGRTVAIAYNGNLPDYERAKLKKRIPGSLRNGPNFDTLDIVHAIAAAQGTSWKERIYHALDGVYLAYSLIILTDMGELFALKCPSQTWPLWVGENSRAILFASETRVNKGNGLVWKEVKAGELVKATVFGIERTQLFPPTASFRCALHDQYGARSDSRMTEKITFREFRIRLGEELAREHPLHADCYVAVPHSGTPMAEGYAKGMGKKLTKLIKLVHRKRSFISRNDQEISAVVNGKYLIKKLKKIQGKRVVLIDDSLIRGRTAGGDLTRGVKGVVQLVREAGAKEVHFAVTLPKFTKDCDMGYYIKRDTLIGLVKRSDGKYEELDEIEIAERIGADSVHYLSLQGIQNAYTWALGKNSSACFRCMGGTHPLSLIKKIRNQKEQDKQRNSHKHPPVSQHPVLQSYASPKESVLRSPS